MSAFSSGNEATATRGHRALAAMFCANGFIVGSWAPQIPLILTRLEISESTLGLLILGFGLGALIAMPLCGSLIPYHGSRRVLSVMAVGCTFGLALVVAMPSVWLAAPAMVLFGALVGGMDVAMNTNAVVVERRIERAVMSSLHGFWSLGGFAGGAMGGFVILRFGYLPHALLVGLITLGVILAARGYLLNEDDPAPQTEMRLVLPRQPAIYVIGAIALFAMVPEGAILDWAALYLRQERGADIATASFAFAAFSATMALMRFTGDHVRNRLGAVTTLRISSLIAAFGIAMAGLSPTPGWAIATFALAGVGLANIIPTAFSAAGNQPGLSASAGMSVVTTLGYTGILAAPSMIGFIGQKTGFAPIFIALSGFLIAISFAARFVSAADS